LKKKNDIFTPLLVAAIIILVNIIAQYYYKAFDFTDDKRYTLSDSTVKLLKEQKDVIFVKVLLDGEFPAGFVRLQKSAGDILNEFRSINPKIDFEFENPLDGTAAEINKAKEQLRKQGILPVTLFIGEGNSRTEKSIYPYAIFNFGKRVYVVNLLESQVSGVPQEEVLNNSVALLEYKFANAIQKLRMQKRGEIVFITGKDEIDDFHLASLYKKLGRFYNVNKLNIDSTYKITSDIDLLIVPGPVKKFSKKNQFVIDQYLMHGGNIIWMIDKIHADLDSINKHKFYTPELIDNGLDDLFFKYGVRINPVLVQDLQCTKIPQVIGMNGGKPQIENFPWYYDLLVNSISDHPVSKGLSDIYMPFVSTIDTIKTSPEIKKTVLLTSSRRSRYQLYPMRLTYQILHYKPDISLFNKSFLPISVLVEGKFTSFFKNRLTSETKDMLEKIGDKFIDHSEKKGKMIFVGDADFVKNLYNSKTGEFTPIGFNKWENHKFEGNEDFIINSVEYMMDESGILSARAKRVKLRLLDKAKLMKEKTKWQLINILVPLILLSLFGIAFNYYRKRKYS
jgi:gliding-associated putative ABC transporter substrate-binding component GldG